MEDIDKMQYGFMPWRWTVESVFGLRKLNERFRVKNKKYVLFFDLEKTFDQVPREVCVGRVPHLENYEVDFL